MHGSLEADGNMSISNMYEIELKWERKIQFDSTVLRKWRPQISQIYAFPIPKAKIQLGNSINTVQPGRS